MFIKTMVNCYFFNLRCVVKLLANLNILKAFLSLENKFDSSALILYYCIYIIYFFKIEILLTLIFYYLFFKLYFSI